MSKRAAKHSSYKKLAPSRKRPARSAAAARVQMSGTSSVLAEKKDYRSVDQPLLLDPLPRSVGAAGLFRLNDIQPGDEVVNRQGKRIAYKSLRVRGYLKTTFGVVPSTGLQIDQLVRVVLIYTTNPSPAPVWSNIFGGRDDANAPVTSNTYSNLEPAQLGIWTILRDETFVIKPDYTGFGSGFQYEALTHVDMYVNLKGLNANYGSSGTDPEQCQGNLWLAILPREDQITFGCFTGMYLNSRVTFQG